MTTETQSPKPAAPLERKVRLVLFFSVALNLLFVGLIAGAIFRNDGRVDRRGAMNSAFDAGIGPFGRAFTREQRREFNGALGHEAKRLRDNRAAVRGHVNGVVAAIVQEPFDAQALRDQMQAMQDGLQARQHIGIEVFVGQIAQMSEAERHALADRLEHSIRKPRRGRN